MVGLWGFLFAWGVCLVFVLFFVLTKPVLSSLFDEELD